MMMGANRDDSGWGRTLLILSITAAVAVSVIYLPQSLLGDFAANLGVDATVASIIATAVQGGYALGIFLFVPLADRIQPRRQVTVQGLILVVALLVSAVLPTVAAVAIGFLIVGLVANIAQVIIPAASRLAPLGRSGASTSALAGAILMGIFGGRVVASLLVDAIGWRWVVVIFAGLVLAILPLARRALATHLPLEGGRRSYGALLVSTLRLAKHSPTLLQSAGMQFFIFATFNSIWTIMVLHLTGPEFGWSVPGAGLFGLIGLAAGMATPFVGRYIDRFGALPVAGILLATLLVAIVSIVVDSGVIVAFGISMFVATWANQSLLSANQSRVLAANPGRSAQANTLFMFGVFLGGAAGAFLGPLAYAAGGMPLVALQAIAFVLIASVAWGLAVTSSRRATRRIADDIYEEETEIA